MTMRGDVAVLPVTPPRLDHLDAVRGLAIMLMVADHSLYLFGAPEWLRYGPTRAAMPIFALLSGYLFRRWSSRWLVVAVLGLAFSIGLPFMDQPNILLILAGCAAWAQLVPKSYDPIVIVVCLVSLANLGLWLPHSPSYALPGVLALFLFGRSYCDRLWWCWGRSLPSWLAPVGRYPLTIYVGHVLALVMLAGVR